LDNFCWVYTYQDTGGEGAGGDGLHCLQPSDGGDDLLIVKPDGDQGVDRSGNYGGVGGGVEGLTPCLVRLGGQGRGRKSNTWYYILFKTQHQLLEQFVLYPDLVTVTVALLLLTGRHHTTGSHHTDQKGWEHGVECGTG